DSGTSDADDKTSDTTPTIRVSLNGSGAAAPVAGDVVKLYEGNTQVGSATLTAQNVADDYVDITSNAVSAGSNSFSATITDAASNTSNASAALAVVIDTTAPVLASASVSGSTLTLTYTETGSGMGAAVPAPGDFTVTTNGSTGVSVDAVTVDAANGTVTLTLASAVTNADTVTVSYAPGTNKIQDIAGNAAGALDDEAVTNGSGDTTAPAAPLLSLRPVSDSGSSDSDLYTRVTMPTVRATLQGTGANAAVAGDVVKVYLGGAAIGTATLSGTDIANGYVDIETGNLGADGGKSLTAKVTDAANNTSDASPTLSLTLDTSVAAPSLSLVTDSGKSGSDGITNTGALSVDGIEAGASVEYSRNGTTWSGSYSLSEGGNTVYVRQTDRAGNVSGASSLNFVLDTRIATPTITLANDTGSSKTDKITSDPSLNVGGLETGATVEYSSDGSSWSGSFTAVEGVNTVRVRQTDIAGNASAAGSLTFTYDPRPNPPSVGLASDTGSGSADRVTKDGTLTVSGVKNGAAVEYSTDGVHWSSSFSPAEGKNTVFVRQVSVSGAASEPAAFSFTLDTTIAAPTIDLETDSGFSAGDRITNTAALKVGGVETGAKVEYSKDGVSWSGSFTAVEGQNTAYVRQTDIAGNVSAASSIGFRLDTRVAAPGIALQSGNGSSTVSDPGLNVTGIEDGARVEYSIDGSNWGGGFTAVEGANTVYVRQTDIAGNVGGPSSISFTLNTLTALPGTGTPTTGGTTAPGTSGGGSGGSGGASGPTTGTGTTTSPTDSAAGGSSGSPGTGSTTVVNRGGSGTTAGSGDLIVPGNQGGAATLPTADTIAPIITGSSQGQAASPGSGMSSFNSADQTSTQPTGRINLLAGIPLPDTGARSNGNGPDNQVLASTDRGFPVSRVQSPAAAADNGNKTDAKTGSNPAIDIAQQKGSDRLFVYQGIRDTAVQGGTGIDYFVPREAFGHTNVNAVVQLDASLLDGSPLPEWLDFDPVSGRFTGRPPAGENAAIVIKVIARDNDGREASSTFSIKVQQAPDKAAGDSGREQPAQRTAGKEVLPGKVAEAPVKKSVPFAEQLRQARPGRDPLLARIAEAGTQTNKTVRPQRTS
ncbi:MAG TPA: Ig-like domain-containing protein, partial [Noviherbaspirillum sp.]|uniref:Ig-like domain-containing protein n=1 Tax=Noviherbaspirillum sp. TaxID=1926288 RepID=UPI002D37CEC8